MSIQSVIPSKHLILCRPLLLLPSIYLSIRVFSNESAFHIRWPKYWRFNFSISLSDEYSGLISFRIDWFDHLAFQGILKSLLQHHSSKASILQCSAFFMVQFSHPHMTTGKIIALTIWTFVSKVMSLLFKVKCTLNKTFYENMHMRGHACWVASLSANLCLTFCDPMSCSPPDSSVHGVLQAKILELVAMPSSRGSSQTRDQTPVFYVSCIGRQVLYHKGQLGTLLFVFP